MQPANTLQNLPPYKFTIGCDPEVFVHDAEKNIFLSAHNLILGTKRKPHAVDYGAYQRDGVAAEININPARDADEFSFNMSAVFAQLNQTIKGKNPNYELVAVPVADFPPDDFAALPDSVKAFGCDVEYSAHTRGIILKQPNNSPFRTGGGHVHIGWSDKQDLFEAKGALHIEDCEYLTRALDMALLVPSVLWDRDDRRRQLYGAPGSFRPKKYGCEYRSLSNAWVFHEELKRWIFASTMAAAKRWEQGQLYTSFYQGDKVIDQMMEGKPASVESATAHYLHLRACNFVPPLPKEFLP